MDHARIVFDLVNLQYNEKKIFAGFSMKVGQGRKVVVAGRSGSGKSSLFSLVLGFARPDSGTVLFDGDPVTEKTVWDVRRRIALVDQDVSGPAGRVSDWIGFVSRLKACAGRDFTTNRVMGLFDFFELGHDLLDTDVSRLSGGERQRVAIVVAALLGRDVFFLDEVTASLDKHLKKKTVHFFIRQKGWTVIAVSHDSAWLDAPDVNVFDLEERVWIR